MKKEQLEFAMMMAREFGTGHEVQAATLRLLSLAKSYQAIAVHRSNVGDDDYAMKRKESLERSLSKVAKTIGAELKLGGDPRGFAVKVMTPKTKMANSWGGAEDGWGVPA